MSEHFMTGVEDAHNPRPCREPDLNRNVTAYCFGEATGYERERFEAHLLECDFCWAEVQRLDSIVRALRNHKEVTRPLLASALTSVLGISGKITTWLGGHALHALLASSVYALLYGIALPIEIAYQWERFGGWAILTSLLLLVWIVSTTLLALWVDVKLVVSGRRSGAVASASVIIGSAALLYFALRPFLPDYSITQATFQTYTAQTAYLKSIFYFVPFAVIYLVIPLHFVLVMQRELNRGRLDAVYSVLAHRSMSVIPRGTVYPRFSVLCGLMTIGAGVSIYMGAHLLENLRPTPYTNLFIHLIQIRWCLYLFLGLECLAWYYHTLQELKRECVAAQSIQAQNWRA